MIFLAVPFSAHQDVAKQFKQWNGKIVVDLTNTLHVAPEELGGLLSSEVVSQSFAGARRVKAFNHLPADELEAAGVIHELEEGSERLEAIAGQHLAAIREGMSSLVVAPTHAECRAIAERVRKQLKAVGLVGLEDREVTRLARLNLTEAQRRDPISYHAGQVVDFHRRARGGFKSGEKWLVIRRDENSVIVSRNGKEARLPIVQANAFELYSAQTMTLAPGDSVRITKNFRCGATRFTNNELCRVTSIDDAGIRLEDGRLIRTAEALHLDQGIAVTSHASQGKTVDQVIVSAPVSSFSQVNQAQFYVSMSRARRVMHLYTDSKAALKEAVMRPSQRLSPAELIEESGVGGKNGVEVPAESREKALLCGEIPCEILRETLHNLDIGPDAECRLSSGRPGTKGQDGKVPKYAIRREEPKLTR